MQFYKKIIGLPDSKGVAFKCHNYSKVMDIDVYKGGYGNYYCNVYYTSPGDVEQSENKQVTIACISESDFLNKEYRPTEWDKKREKITIDDKFKFLKSVSIKHGNISSRYFFFIYEQLSIEENRDVKINETLD